MQERDVSVDIGRLQEKKRKCVPKLGREDMWCGIVQNRKIKDLCLKDFIIKRMNC